MDSGRRFLRSLEEEILVQAARRPRFTYSPLPSTGRFIRLVDVQRDKGSDIIQCSLREVDLDSNPDFDALSYTWQKVVQRYWSLILKLAVPALSREHIKSGASKVILCNGRVIHVQDNLYDFLIRFRQQNQCRSLWIDAICINQDDLTERSSQVNMMRDIYGSASMVVVWLGDSSKRTLGGVKYMETLPDSLIPAGQFRTRDYILGPDPPRSLGELLGNSFSAVFTKLPGLRQVLLQEYFQRTWVVQEIILARTLRFYLGAVEVPAEVLLRGIGLYSSMGKLTDMSSGVQFERTGFLTLPYIFHARDQLRQGISWPLHDYLSLCRDRRVTEPKDKAFAILGVADPETLLLSSEAQVVSTAEETIPGQEMSVSALLADYSHDVFRVYLDCTRCLLRKTSLSYVLSLVGKMEKGVEGLPTWIPDYSVPLRPKPFSSFSPARFAAASGLASSYTISEDGRTLSLSAAVLDTIAKVAEWSGALNMMEKINLRGHMLDLVSDLGETYMDTGELSLAAFFGTLTTDVFAGSGIPSEELYTEFVHWFTEIFYLARELQKHKLLGLYLKLASKFFRKMGSGLEERRVETDALRIDAALKRFETIHGDFRPGFAPDLTSHSRVASAIESIYKDRRLFRTTKGYLGIGPSALKEGDTVVLISGANIPFILRQQGGLSCFSFVGSSYVHGIMCGEALGLGGLEFRTINVV